MDRAELVEEAKKLQDMYRADIGPGIEDDLISFRAFYKNDLGDSLTSAREILKFIVEEELEPSYRDLTTALRLLLVIPVTVASAERSFSKLKLIKTYLRTTMVQERLSSLALLSIEKETSKAIDLRQIARSFISTRPRFINKLV